jgi:hypothetical protein
MKALILAAALAALSSAALAGAAREAHAKSDPTTVAVIADAGRLSSTGLTTLSDGSPWAGRSDAADFDTAASQVEPGYLLMALCVLGLALSRPVSRLLRRREQQRRATALASTLGHQLHH